MTSNEFKKKDNLPPKAPAMKRDKMKNFPIMLTRCWLLDAFLAKDALRGFFRTIYTSSPRTFTTCSTRQQWKQWCNYRIKNNKAFLYKIHLLLLLIKGTCFNVGKIHLFLLLTKGTCFTLCRNTKHSQILLYFLRIQMRHFLPIFETLYIFFEREQSLQALLQTTFF